MKLADFDFELPESAIAQEPCPTRDLSRLLVLDRSTGVVEHRRFRELTQLLREGDLLVVNDTRVVPARVVGRKDSGGRVELLLIEPVEATATWRCMMRAAKPPRPGSIIELGHGTSVRVLEPDAEGSRVAFIDCPGSPLEMLERLGAVPLPPYIKRGEAGLELDRERYQTVYARHPGAVAAPTAGLHFTEELLEQLARGGVRTASITLHVGPGTFLPIRAADLDEHRMHAERFEVGESAAAEVARARVGGGRVVAVGTTVVRALESAAARDGAVRPASGSCRLFIRPGHRFRAIDAMVTNFHLPRSTLLVLVSAFAGRERVLGAYAAALRAGYRFYSYGDAMLLGDFA